MRAAPSRQDRIRARRFYDGMIRDVNRELAEYGRINPDFGIPFEEAQVGFGTLARSNLASNWIKDNVTYNPVTTGLLHLFGGGLGAAAVKSGVSGTTLGAPLAVYETGKLLYRINRSPALRRYYFGALQGAARENVQLFSRSIQKLDKALEGKDKKEKSFRLLD